MLRVVFIFSMAWNIRPYCSNHIINILLFIFLFIVIFNLYLLFFSLRYFSLTFNEAFIKNYEPHFPLSKQLLLFFILNISWYKLNHHTNTIICSFPPTAISLVVYLSYLSESSISNNLSYDRAENNFWLIFISLGLASYVWYCFLSNNIPVPELFYTGMSFVTQDKLHIKCFIPRLVIYPICNLVLWSQPFTLLLFF